MDHKTDLTFNRKKYMIKFTINSNIECPQNGTILLTSISNKIQIGFLVSFFLSFSFDLSFLFHGFRSLRFFNLQGSFIVEWVQLKLTERPVFFVVAESLEAAVAHVCPRVTQYGEVNDDPPEKRIRVVITQC